MEYHYRKEFGLTEEELKKETWDSVRMNLAIMRLYNDKEQMEALERQRDIKRNTHD